MNESPIEAQSTTLGKNNRPIESWRAGPIQVSVWENTAVDEAGAPRTYQTVSFDRRYKDDRTGEWKSTNSLRRDDLPKAALLLNKAYEYLLLGEDE